MREWRVMDCAGGAVYVCGGDSKGACVGLSIAPGLYRAGRAMEWISGCVGDGVVAVV